MTNQFLNSAGSPSLVALVLLALVPSVTAYTEVSPPPKSIPVRLFVGYREEEELQIVAAAATGNSDTGTPAFLTGDHYWTKRLGDSSIKSRLDLWASAPEGFDEQNQLLVFCTFVDPNVKIDPNLHLPAELTGLDVRVTVRAVRREWNKTEYEIAARVGLIPGIERVYLLDGRTSTWSSRTFRVELGRGPDDGFPL